MITSMANGKIKHITNLQKKRGLRDTEQVFLTEGVRMFREAPVDRIQEIYASESFYKKERELLERVAREAQVCPELVSDAVYAHMSDTKTPQGILCVVKRKEASLSEILKRKPPLLLVLDNLQDPGNLGTIVRAAEGAGATGILLSRDSVDIYNPKTVRSTMGSLFRMPFLCVEDTAQAVQKLNRAGVHTYAAALDGSTAYDTEDYRAPCAFLIGNEGNGLKGEVAACAKRTIRIPMEGQVESLNAAAAATILMFEAARQRRRK